jgi:hypothetical protein
MIHITLKVTTAGLTEKITQAVHESITQ